MVDGFDLLPGSLSFCPIHSNCVKEFQPALFHMIDNMAPILWLLHCTVYWHRRGNTLLTWILHRTLGTIHTEHKRKRSNKNDKNRLCYNSIWRDLKSLKRQFCFTRSDLVLLLAAPDGNLWYHKIFVQQILFVTWEILLLAIQKFIT